MAVLSLAAMADREDQLLCATPTPEAAGIRSPAGRCGDDDVAGLFLASTAGQEPFHIVGRRRASAFPLASKAGQEKSPPAASSLQQEIHRLAFI
jgi:hypothetical protein